MDPGGRTLRSRQGPQVLSHSLFPLLSISIACSSFALRAIVALKSDLKDREVSEKEGREFAEHSGLAFIETSAATGENVNAAFEAAARLILEAVQNGQLTLDDSEED